MEISKCFSWIVACCGNFLFEIDGSEVVVFIAKGMAVVMYW
jgi:hypothetical protein